ncbi:MAG: hypothetical protein KGK16_11045 [Bradyrhizobium sp.]|uniref:hypothetical protein n=1 Tax=Bradyrhizobium sp. TaxID=376 RepID=UPI001EBD4155|nr:hypothetical protein [Bradyrhizobium sp.]MBU6457067.1 hypothetical protein [Bradyrhizobium sp.]MDE2331304.1 hypothetical protein [Bradyrhizobium sp.]MDE2600894.1 hypothetical protein [Bradyrhizobium sp.]
MRITLALVALLYSTAAMAQASPPPAAGSPPTASSPPTVGEQPLLQVKPRAQKKAVAVPVSAKSTSVAKKLQACLEIDDGTKGRLDCYDAVFPPKPNPKAKPGDRVADCHFIKEEDERLNCYNGFAEKIPKF